MPRVTEGFYLPTSAVFLRTASKKPSEERDVDLKQNRCKDSLQREHLMRQESDDVKPHLTLCQEYVSMPSAGPLLLRTLWASEVLECN